MTTVPPQVVTDERGTRFEVAVDGQTAELSYRVAGDRMVLVHTEVPDAFEGMGIGSDLVRAAVEHARRNGLTIVPRCPFARGWLERHPRELERVAIDWSEPDER
jgi:predicted GNAT family acetyltransferase